jgi:hypothetical protein
MATIRLYTTALEHQTTQDITWRGTRYHLPAGTDQGSSREIVRVDSIDKPAGEITIAQVVERDGETATYWVDGIAAESKWRQIGDGNWNAVREETTEYTLTALSDDAARIVEAVLAKPAPTQINNYNISTSGLDADYLARMQRQINAMFQRKAYAAGEVGAKPTRIEFAEKAVRVANMHREAAYQRLRNMPWNHLRGNDPRGVADKRLALARNELAQAIKDDETEIDKMSSLIFRGR